MVEKRASFSQSISMSLLAYSSDFLVDFAL